MKPPPSGWPRLSPVLCYPNSGEAIDWLRRAFGFEIRLKVEGENGMIHHSELVLGDGVIIVCDENLHKAPERRTPAAVGGSNTQNLYVYVDDVEEHLKRVRDAGATILCQPKATDYGDDWVEKSFECRDIGGHHWWFAQRIETPG